MSSTVPTRPSARVRSIKDLVLVIGDRRIINIRTDICIHGPGRHCVNGDAVAASKL